MLWDKHRDAPIDRAAYPGRDFRGAAVWRWATGMYPIVSVIGYSDEVRMHELKVAPEDEKALLEGGVRALVDGGYYDKQLGRWYGNRLSPYTPRIDVNEEL